MDQLILNEKNRNPCTTGTPAFNSLILYWGSQAEKVKTSLKKE